MRGRFRLPPQPRCGSRPAAIPAAEVTAKPADGAAVAPQQPFATNHPLSEKDKKRAMKMAQDKAKQTEESSGQGVKAAKSAAGSAGIPDDAATPSAPPQPSTPPQRSDAAAG